MPHQFSHGRRCFQATNRKEQHRDLRLLVEPVEQFRNQPLGVGLWRESGGENYCLTPILLVSGVFDQDAKVSFGDDLLGSQELLECSVWKVNLAGRWRSQNTRTRYKPLSDRGSARTVREALEVG